MRPVGLARYYSLVAVNILVGAFIAIYPLSEHYDVLRPELLCLLVIYWVINAPQYFGVLFAWTVGLMQDLVEGIVWGAHSMALAIVAYICLVAYQRIKNYSVWHQTLWIFVLVGFHQVIVDWVQGLAGYKASPTNLLLSATVSALFWPVIFFVISRIRFSYRIN